MYRSSYYGCKNGCGPTRYEEKMTTDDRKRTTMMVMKIKVARRMITMTIMLTMLTIRRRMMMKG